MGDKLHIKNEPLKTSIYLDNIRSAHNVGSIIRTTEAFSLGTLHFSDKTPYIDNKQVKDTAMGTQGWVECRSNMLLKDLPRPIIILETAHNAIPIHDFIFPDQFTLVVGNEEYGCSDESIQLADIALEIPLVGKKNSLNVANAFAIAAYEIRKQRTYYEQ
jgi:tRNA G18 (ribose-2'-O)-methylase SpoU